MEDLDEWEKNLLRSLCRAATKKTGYIETVRSFILFDPQADALTRDVADSLEYKGYIEITNKDYGLKLTGQGVNYCTKLKELL
jgi:hypothetical protein